MEMEKSNCFVLRSHTTWQVGLSIQALLDSLVIVGFPGGLDGKESTCSVGDRGLIPGLGRSPGEGHGNPLQYSCLENLHGQKSLVGCSLGGHKESDTERLSTKQYPFVHMCHIFFIHSSLGGHLGFFHVLAIVNSAAMNIGVHGSF